jgi:hypothetical protein
MQLKTSWKLSYTLDNYICLTSTSATNSLKIVDIYVWICPSQMLSCHGMPSYRKCITWNFSRLPGNFRTHQQSGILSRCQPRVDPRVPRSCQADDLQQSIGLIAPSKTSRSYSHSLPLCVCVCVSVWSGGQKSLAKKKVAFRNVFSMACLIAWFGFF